MVKEIIRVGREPDGGYTDYVFPKEGGTDLLRRDPTAGHFDRLAGLSERNYVDYIDETVEENTRQCGRM